MVFLRVFLLLYIDLFLENQCCVIASEFCCHHSLLKYALGSVSVSSYWYTIPFFDEEAEARM